MKKVLALLMVLVLAVSVFAACGEDDKKDKETESVATESPATTEAPAATDAPAATTQQPATTDAPTTVPTQQPTQAPATLAPSSAYDKIFEGTGIVHFQAFFGLETANFAKKNEDGTILCDDLGYEGDVVKQEVVTMYVSIAGYTAEEKTQLETAMKEAFSACDELECCTVQYNMGSRYFSVSLEIKDMDKAENISALYEAGLIDVNGAVSFNTYKTDFLSDGMVQK